ncbi:histidine kinase [Actinoplanes sp. CA-252034]|uniref:sensor histidine kinase n=1 Tax=Actinoplanes sp. CA-252034 TaxID=3239906 RepID=UPI003D98A1B2
MRIRDAALPTGRVVASALPAGLAAVLPAGLAAVAAAAVPAGLAAVVAAVALTGADDDDRALWPWGWALILVSSAAVLWRRRHPIPVLAVTGAACLAYYPLGFPDSPLALFLLVALYTVARTHGPLPSGAAAAGLLLLVTVTASDPLPTAAAVGPLLALPVVLGEVIRGRARQTAQAEDRRAVAEDRRAMAEERTAQAEERRTLADERTALAEERAVLAEEQAVLAEERAVLADAARRSAEAARAGAESSRRHAEESRENEALRRAAEERLRISRELHDALGHQLSLISVQAGAALHTRAPDAAFAALTAIRAASGDALRDLREVLGVLREPVRPGLAALPELVDRTSATGLTVHTTIDVPDPAPAPEVQQAAYRIVQEALTNAVRHASAGAAVHVTIRQAPGSSLADPPRAGDAAPGPPFADPPRTGDPAPATAAGEGAVGRRVAGSTLVVVVENDGDEVGEVVAGGGVRGMAERVASLGGAFSAEPRPGGGFRVEARLPTVPPASEPPVGPGPPATVENGAR